MVVLFILTIIVWIVQVIVAILGLLLDGEYVYRNFKNPKQEAKTRILLAFIPFALTVYLVNQKIDELDK